MEPGFRIYTKCGFLLGNYVDINVVLFLTLILKIVSVVWQFIIEMFLEQNHVPCVPIVPFTVNFKELAIRLRRTCFILLLSDFAVSILFQADNLEVDVISSLIGI
jgi:hypothetical protein